MKAIILLPAAAALAALGGCVVTGGPTETRAYVLSGFDTIRADSGINVVLSQGPFAVKAEAPEGGLDRIEVVQEGNELRLSRKPEIVFFIGNMGRHVVYVSAPGYARVTASGGADVEASGLTLDALKLDAAGGGDIDLTGVRIGVLEASASGGGDIDITGSCVTATIETSGGGDFSGEDLDCQTVTASASGGGDIDVGASLSATGKASAGGDVRFFGAPPTFNKDEGAGGDVSLEAR